MYSNAIIQYMNGISRTRRGLQVLIADDLIIEQIAFLETIRHYLPESTAQAVNRSELEDKLTAGNEYDLVILEEYFLIDQPDRLYISRVRNKYPKAKIALFIDTQNLYRQQTTAQLSNIDIILTKCSTVEAIAEKLCLTFQERQ